ncbi:slit homolog 2 protein-like [Rhinatrema bivittatum]|uniref:slit homolog 2 protein-like n=1 Tax=Rhinatrema bivittatum TaxID=194408 RepID=UPI001126C4DB|nr:slit homolog 2 protein-like [Rhinatrema bivittatum]
MFLFIVTFLLCGLPLESSKACPDVCVCYESSGFIDCRGHGLTQVPKNIPDSTWMLDLRQNNLSKLIAGSFSALWSMKILLLTNNYIEEIHSKAFEYLGFLERLDLSNNLLSQLPHDFSIHLVSLRELKMPFNWLTSLSFESFEHLESLEKLDLSNNQVISIDKGAFQSLSKLRYLFLQCNRLEVVQCNSFFMLQKLEVLHLAKNNISIIDVEAFSSLHSLNLLILSNNCLSHLKFKTFLNIQTLSTHLQLLGNPWICDCDLQRVFGKIMSVRHLHMDDYENITCSNPWQLAGHSLMSVDTQLCVAETATVLVITITVLVTVIAAIVMAERNRKKNQEKNWNELDGPIDLQEK